MKARIAIAIPFLTETALFAKKASPSFQISLPETFRQVDKLFVNRGFTPIRSMFCKQHHRLGVVFPRACYFRALHIYFHIIDLFCFKEAIRKICGQFILEVREGEAKGVNLTLAVFTQECFTLWAPGMRPEPALFSPACWAPCLSLEGKDRHSSINSGDSTSQPWQGKYKQKKFCPITWLPPSRHRSLALDDWRAKNTRIWSKLGTIWLLQLGTPDHQENWQILVANIQSTVVSQHTTVHSLRNLYALLFPYRASYHNFLSKYGL